jgi:hypothetical protein
MTNNLNSDNKKAFFEKNKFIFTLLLGLITSGLIYRVVAIDFFLFGLALSLMMMGYYGFIAYDAYKIANDKEYEKKYLERIEKEEEEKKKNGIEVLTIIKILIFLPASLAVFSFSMKMETFSTLLLAVILLPKEALQFIYPLYHAKRHFMLAMILLVLIGNHIVYPSYKYRYKMTVEVETPQGIKTGSSVIEVHSTFMPGWMGLNSSDRVGGIRISGEGAFVDVAEGKTLFVLLGGSPKSRNPHSLLTDAVPFSRKNGDKSGPTQYEYMRYYGTLKNAKGILPRDEYPRMVSAIVTNNRNIEFQVIETGQIEKVFGTDIKIRQIIVETTNDPLEWKMRKLSMWNEIIKYGDDKAMDNIYLDFVTSIE